MKALDIIVKVCWFFFFFKSAQWKDISIDNLKVYIGVYFSLLSMSDKLNGFYIIFIKYLIM